MAMFIGHRILGREKIFWIPGILLSASALTGWLYPDGVVAKILIGPGYGLINYAAVIYFCLVLLISISNLGYFNRILRKDKS